MPACLDLISLGIQSLVPTQGEKEKKKKKTKKKTDCKTLSDPIRALVGCVSAIV